MTKDIEIHDVTLGSGDEVQVGRTVILNLRVFLHKGEEVFIIQNRRSGSTSRAVDVLQVFARDF